jgi:2-C-methyl-D-erythritol 4-phosphate cytidylyltransferase / 2-C-methyl-D-erythritol 2,4-cyclodiphosphate synthase
MNLLPKVPLDCVALVVAAGRGNRFGGDLPKQYVKLNGVSLLKRSLDILGSHHRIQDIRVVIHPDDIEYYKEVTKDINILDPIFGGEQRQESVRLGLQSFKEINPQYVIIHDAVRPFISNDIIDALLTSLNNQHLAVIPGLSVKDSLKRVNNEKVIASVDRTDLWQAQTPQGFNYKTIMEAHTLMIDCNLTDDAAVAEKNGVSVKVIEGSSANFKVTTPLDFERGENYLNFDKKAKSTRVGIGYDVHRFKSGISLTLCGIEIPFNKSLKGHSDADVAMHALTDALLGTIGGGDIGLIFPPNDPQWENSSSTIFLEYASNEIKQLGGEIINIDLTIICEKPKITNFRDRMQKNIAKILNISVKQVNIKATTTEKLGCTGREEGIAAQAIAGVQI